jgi:glutamyl-tRNA(Gln) amidotransferase subunit E
LSSSIDYAEVGLIAGLEVHQQLLTAIKMFCRCPAGRYTETHDGFVLRHMRPTLSELGEYDGTALMEFKTKKNIIYLLHKENVCTYEMDDTPPFLVNQEAVDIAIEQCLMLGCDIIDEVHIARKQYLDGSIPTGFQRTAIVGVNGRLPFRGRALSITQVSVEEDSCREVSDSGHLIIWRTDRLGMPLIETVTGPDLRTPDEVEEAILLVGRVCRSTGHVRVGIGASRQDVNVSVRGGRRVEIKGVPQAGWAPKLVHGEAVRQVNLLKLRDELVRRGFASPDKIAVESADVTEIFSASEFLLLRRDRWERWVTGQNRRPGFELGAGPFCVRAVRLKSLAGTLTWPSQPEQIFAAELAGRIRVIAGPDQRPILLHSEKWPDYQNSLQELRKVRSRLNCTPDDSLVIVWGPEEDTVTAANEIRLRYIDALNRIPNETRQPFPDGSTDFERILPGPDRMYPDTDSPPSRVTRERVARRHDRLAAGLSDRRGHTGIHPGRVVRRRAGAGRYLQPDYQEAVRGFLREHGPGTVCGSGPSHRRRDRSRRRWDRDRARYRHDGSHGGDPVVYGAGLAGPDRAGGIPALERPAFLRRRPEPDPRGPLRRLRRHCRGADLRVRADVGSQWPASSWHALPQDAQLLPQHLPHDRRHSSGHRQPRQLHLHQSGAFEARSLTQGQDRSGLRRPGIDPLLLSRYAPGSRGRPG